jgi:5-methylcytosine-specific restriction protein B
LLQEYFYGDFGKIGLVLGEGFIKKEEKKIEFADFDYGSNLYEEMDTFKIIEINDKFEIIPAIRVLMRQGPKDGE